MRLRLWHLTKGSPFAAMLAADSRFVTIDSRDDQRWHLALGTGDSPAVALETTYNGRAGLVSLVPMWTLEGAPPRYMLADYAEPPFIRHFAPGYMAVESALTPALRCVIEYRLYDSHTVAGRISVQNTSDQTVTLRADLIAFVALHGREGKVALAALSDETLVLSLGTLGDLQPVLALDHPMPVRPESKTRLGVDMTLSPGADAAVRFGCAALPMIEDSGRAAAGAAALNWDMLTEQIERGAASIPDFETGDADFDAVIAFSYQTALQAADPPLTPQTAPTTYLLATALAAVDPQRAQRILRAAIDAQTNTTPNGLWMPILAKLAAQVHLLTADKAFLRDILPNLIAFFNRWRTECDADGDGTPEWQADGQNGLPFVPTFALSDPNGQHADIRTVESPDMAAYLLAEARALDFLLGSLDEAADVNTGWAAVEFVPPLSKRLADLWRADWGRFAYRDRDSHQTPPSIPILQDGRASEEHFIALDLMPAARMIIEITGGTERKPSFSLVIDGIGTDGQAQRERIDSDQVEWRYSRGSVTTQLIFSRIDTLRAEGLTAGYRIAARTPDWTRLDITALLPLLDEPPRKEVLALLRDEQRFWRPYGIPAVAADDPHYVPAENGAVQPFFLAMIGNALLSDPDSAQLAREWARRLLRAQIETLKQQHAFAASYHPETGAPIGTRGDAAGIFPPHLWSWFVGVHIQSPVRVVLSAFKWDEPVIIRQHGVTVKRTPEGSEISFPSGAIVPYNQIDGIVDDPTPPADPPPADRALDDPDGDPAVTNPT